VLLIDLDPQGNASTGLGVPPAKREPGSYHLLIRAARLEDVVRSTLIPRLAIVPSGVALSGAEIELAGQEDREFFLREALDDGLETLDYVLIDCPPALGLLTINALAAARSVLVPLQCEFFALEGVSHLLRTIDLVKRSINPRLDIEGILLTMFDKRNKLSDLVATDVRAHFRDKVYQTVIPRNVRISEAPSHGRPVLVYDTQCPGSQAYIHLAGEVLRREKERRP
jgi:chromosome partitioning protein